MLGSHKQSPQWLARFADVVYYLSIVVLVASLMDLFIGRLLFRAGPDVLSHLVPTGGFYFATVGRISLTIEQILLFIILGTASILLMHDERNLTRLLGSLVIVTVACSLFLYAPLGSMVAWTVSTLLVLTVAVTIPVFAYLKISEGHKSDRRQRLAVSAFLACLVFSFMLPLYFRMYLLLGAAGLASLPFPLEAYLAGIYFVMASMIAAFVYAAVASARGFTLGYRTFAKAAILPTIVVVPIFYAMVNSFFVVQILALVVAMSTDFVLSHTLLEAIVLLSWFYLTAILLLFLKGHYSRDRMLKQEGIGLVLIMSTTFLFNYPYYLMLGTTGVLLFCYSLRTVK